MTKKDYTLLASAIASLPPHAYRDQVARAIAFALSDANRRFDVGKFLSAIAKTPSTAKNGD